MERSWGRWEGVQEIIRGGEEDAIVLREERKGRANCKYWEWGGDE